RSRDSHFVSHSRLPSRKNLVGKRKIRSPVCWILWNWIDKLNAAARYKACNVFGHFQNGNFAIITYVQWPGITDLFFPKELFKAVDNIIDVAPTPRLVAVAINR